jgi:hypothetical protein
MEKKTIMTGFCPWTFYEHLSTASKKLETKLVSLTSVVLNLSKAEEQLNGAALKSLEP